MWYELVLHGDNSYRKSSVHEQALASILAGVLVEFPSIMNRKKIPSLIATVEEKIDDTLYFYLSLRAPTFP